MMPGHQGAKGGSGVVYRTSTLQDFSGLATPLAEIDEESGYSTGQ